MTTTAEGIETAEQLASLAAAGCNHAQGFHIGKPQRRSEFERLLGVSKASTSRRAMRR
jgi:EAL domain-containing protein (putative c-di-GMP-specific phosphodiesterase class I)